jgi:hypothetical protein
MRVRTTRKKQDEPLEDLEVRPTLEDIVNASGVREDAVLSMYDELKQNAGCIEVVANNVLGLY